MMLKILLPSGILIEKKDVLRVVAEGKNGFFGLLPHRLDFLSALIPGILIYESKSEGEKFVAINEGVIIKTGLSVLVSVREAVEGKALDQLREKVEEEFLTLDEEEQNVRMTMVKMESIFIKNLAEMRNE
jgi:F-type H+-transporting ATPase subunit epsilon